MSQRIVCGSRTLDVSCPRVMGILNLTADSFSDGGELLAAGRPNADALLARAQDMVEAGAAILDIGAESTRPGAEPVAESEELDRIGAALALLRPRFDLVLSVDTSSSAVMRLAAAEGADFINDVRALREPGAVEAVRDANVAVCLMHMQGEPRTMQADPRYDDVVAEVCDFLLSRVAVCEAAGVARNRLLLDPGFGFGKHLGHNLELLARLDRLAASELPVLVGMSRKRMLGELTGRDTRSRLAAGLAAAVLAVERGAAIVRTHDVAATVDALAVVNAIRNDRAREIRE